MPVWTGRSIFGSLSEPVYSSLRYLEPGLLLDIGASDGHKAALMLDSSPDSHVIAVEPFPANIEQMQAKYGRDPRFTILEKAATDKPGPVAFSVASTLKQDMGPRRAGYSSVGRVVSAPDPSAEVTLEVDTVLIDQMLGSKHAVLMKVDTQGEELAVLRSAAKAIAEHRIDIVYFEFSGHPAELAFVTDRGYFVFDTRYLLVPHSTVSDSIWETTSHTPFKLTTGADAFNAWPRHIPTTDMGYCEFIREQRRTMGWTQTDLVCVSPSALPAFLRAARLAVNDDASRA